MDGGQILYYTIEAITGHPLADRTREIIHYITWIFVLVLVVTLSIKIFGDFFGKILIRIFDMQKGANQKLAPFLIAFFKLIELENVDAQNPHILSIF